VLHSLWEYEANAQFVHDRLAEEVAICRLVAAAGHAPPPAGRLRRAVGLRLIALGRRVAGPAAVPAPWAPHYPAAAGHVS